MGQRKLKKAVLLDRDGTILNERGYLSDPNKMKFYPFAFRALKELQKAGLKLIIVTNQSGVGRKYFTEARLKQINRRFISILNAKGIRISKIYYCPDAPSPKSKCRKPKPAMALRAAREFKLNLKKSYVVGDQDKDVLLAKNIGAKGILVLTGAGRNFRKKFMKKTSKITTNLLTASNWICNDLRRGGALTRPAGEIYE